MVYSQKPTERRFVMGDDQTLLSVTEASRLVGVNPSYINKLLKREEIRGRKVGLFWVVEKASLEEWDARRKSKKRADI
jgi:excisionase family DNA binding protein